jgi:E3 ubiquitin-protein ligase DOA10
MEQKICRVCQDEEENNEKLISPCACDGSQKFIHESCLRTWIKTSNNNETCPTCRSKYKDEFIIEITMMDSKCRNFRELIDVICVELIAALIQFTLFTICVLIIFENKLDPNLTFYIIVPVFIIYKVVDIVTRYYRV